MTVRTRFAPSPTGFLHIGGVRTALFNYLFAKQHNGTFILRLEDTDRERFVPEGVEQIVEALDWLGLKPDEGFWISEGKHQKIEYVQSERQKTGIYQKYAGQLLQEGLAYYSPTTPEELESLRGIAKQEKKPFIYRRSLDKRNANKQLPHVPIRLDVEVARQKLNIGAVGWSDLVRGEFKDDLSIIEDFVLIKSDGFPTYNFANIVDDHDMHISHIIRGDEFISSTGKYALLYKLFDFRPPALVHLPVINGTDGRKLSKRTGDTDVLEYRNKGYLPEALLNFLALLGWNDDTEQEIFSLDELIKKFKIEQINASPAIFDSKRLDWVNGHYIRQLTLDDLHEKTDNFWPKEAHKTDVSYKKHVLALIQDRLKFFGEIPVLTHFFFTEPSENDVQKLFAQPTDKQLKKTDPAMYPNMLTAVLASLQESDFSQQDLTKRLNRLLESLHTKPGVLFALIRIAVTGSSFSPPIDGTMHVLGKEKTITRLIKAQNILGHQA